MAVCVRQASTLLSGARLADGAGVFLRSSGTLPAPLSPTVQVFVRDSVPGVSFAVASTAGGPAIVLTDGGAGVHVVRPAVVRMTASELFESVSDWFALAGSTTALSFGWRSPTVQTNQGGGRANRIVFTPGDADGKAGKVGVGKHGGRERRQAATLDELVTVRVWACDTSRANDERAQYAAARALFDELVLAVRDAQAGRIDIGEPKWTTTPVERSFGRELLCTLTLESPVMRRDARALVSPPALEPEIAGTAVFLSSEVQVFPIA